MCMTTHTNVRRVPESEGTGSEASILRMGERGYICCTRHKNVPPNPLPLTFSLSPTSFLLLPVTRGPTMFTVSLRKLQENVCVGGGGGGRKKEKKKEKKREGGGGGEVALRNLLMGIAGPWHPPTRTDPFHKQSFVTPQRQKPGPQHLNTHTQQSST